MDMLDALAAACLAPLAACAVISGLDELVLDIVTAWHWLRGRSPAGLGRADSLRRTARKRIAIFVPLWQEETVASSMLVHNTSAIRYGEYHVFAGVYPNDHATMDAVREAEGRLAHVHMAIVPHEGPTSKADCLNWIYQAMLAYEEACGLRFDVVVMHDAEDVIHPDSLELINRYTEDYDMVQIPVLPLPTPVSRLTHGVYCDEFAEFQHKDVPARRRLGGFLPSNGVGTGFTRRALDRMAASSHNQLFDPSCLTEDYDCGYRLHRMGFKQVFVPIRMEAGEPVATREYFPQTFRQAVRQRTRWITGICLQAWERHGWGNGPAGLYWFWRDRKGLLGNPLSLLGNFVCLYGIFTWLWCSVLGQPWGLRATVFTPFSRLLFSLALVSQVHRTAVRIGFSARLYGWAFAAAVPLRAAWANAINAIATLAALYGYFRRRLLREPQVWLKTAHTYPALAGVPPLAAPALEAVEVRPELARALPLQFVRRWKVLPVRIAGGALYMATPRAPASGLMRELKRLTRLRAQFELVSDQNYSRLVRALLGQAGSP
jgi:adsorption protein B